MSKEESNPIRLQMMAFALLYPCPIRIVCLRESACSSFLPESRAEAEEMALSHIGAGEEEGTRSEGRAARVNEY